MTIEKLQKLTKLFNPRTVIAGALIVGGGLTGGGIGAVSSAPAASANRKVRYN